MLLRSWWPRTTGPKPLRPVEPNAEVIELLEDVLKRARVGEVNGVFILHTGPSRSIGQGSAGNIDPANMIYSIELWKYRWFQRNEG